MLKDNVLRKNSDFQKVYKNGKSIGERYVVLFYMKNNLSYNRTGILASKKVGNSVIRNRARRLIRESLRNITNLESGYDFIVVARNTIIDKKEYDVENSLKHAFSKAQVIKK